MILKRDNVERIIENETTAKAMIEKGWEEVEIVAERDLSKFKVPDLKALCDEKGIEYESNAKKDVLIALLDSYDKENGLEEDATD